MNVDIAFAAKMAKAVKRNVAVQKKERKSTKLARCCGAKAGQLITD
ncbi:hypothetical protein J2X14_001745 [Pantoea alhagi]|nr:hypothetical protein [Pantoea alhagi]